MIVRTVGVTIGVEIDLRQGLCVIRHRCGHWVEYPARFRDLVFGRADKIDCFECRGRQGIGVATGPPAQLALFQSV